MDQDICPRCRTVVRVTDGVARCPRCGVRRNFSILVKATSRPRSTSIAAGLPPTAPAPEDATRTYLERLLHRLRRWRYGDEPMADADPNIRRERIGWLFLAVSLLPYIIGAPLLVVFPLVAYLTLRPGMQAVDNQSDSLILFLLVAVPLSLVVAFFWYRINRRGV